MYINHHFQLGNLFVLDFGAVKRSTLLYYISLSLEITEIHKEMTEII